MSTLYSWKINSMETRDEGSKKAVVSMIHWTYTATHEDGHTASIDGSSRVYLGDSFIPYPQITEEQAIKWVEDSFADKDKVRSEDSLTSFKRGLDQEIKLKTTLITESVEEPLLPWEMNSKKEEPLK